MKKIFYFIIIVFLLNGCSKSESVGIEATLQGVDQRTCACCGGWLFNLADGETLIADDLPTSFSHNDFPVDVLITYEIDERKVCENHVIIKELTLR